jgi:hypothetical protein
MLARTYDTPGSYFCDERICDALATKRRLQEIKSLSLALGRFGDVRSETERMLEVWVEKIRYHG